MRSFCAVAIVVVLVVSGCNRSPEDGPGGLTEQDFVKISENGLDEQDHAQDQNDYPWSMEYFAPDNASNTGYL